MRGSIVHRVGFLVLASMMLAACGSDYEVGDIVKANYEQRAYAYAAKVTAVDDDQVTVAYLDESETETLPESMVQPLDWDDDTELECAYQGGSTYLPGEIDDFDNPKLHFTYEDGNEEDTTIAMCRERTGDVDEEQQTASAGAQQGARCLSNQRDCGGVCVDIYNDDNNCGGCGNVCPNGKHCDGHLFCRDADGNL